MSLSDLLKRTDPQDKEALYKLCRELIRGGYSKSFPLFGPIFPDNGYFDIKHSIDALGPALSLIMSAHKKIEGFSECRAIGNGETPRISGAGTNTVLILPKEEALFQSGNKTLVLFWSTTPEFEYGKVEKVNLEGVGEIFSLCNKWLREDCFLLGSNEKFVRQGEIEGVSEWLDHDGSNGMGFRLFCERWGYVGECWGAFAALQPIWAWYGK